MKFIGSLLFILSLSGCVVYQSEGRKQIESQGLQLAEASSLSVASEKHCNDITHDFDSFYKFLTKDLKNAPNELESLEFNYEDGHESATWYYYNKAQMIGKTCHFVSQSESLTEKESLFIQTVTAYFINQPI